VEIGAELLAMTAACARAMAMETVRRSEGPTDRDAEPGPIDLADLFCRHARRRVDERFEAVFDNDDVATYRVAQQVLAGQHGWLESGMVKPREDS